MAKTILVPTDFSIRSLHIVKCVLEKNPKEKLDIIQVAGIEMTTSITELLFISKNELIEKASTDEFMEARQIICNRYVEEINTLRLELFNGFTQRAFSNFLEANGIEEIYTPENELHFYGRFFDPIPFMKKSALPRQVISWPEVSEIPGTHRLSELFTNWS